MSELGPEARALLEAGRAALKPKQEDRERIAVLLGSRLDLAGSTPHTQAPTAPPPPAPAASSALSWPVLSAVAGLVVSAGVAVYALRAPEPKPAPVVATASPAPPAAAPAPAPAPAVEPIPPAENLTSAQMQRRPSDRLAEEVAILSRAETELHAGRYQRALVVLAEHERKFPRGTLTQERVAARIRALCGMGRTSEANTLLARLSPGSVHAGRTREACAAGAQK